ncbi:MAG: serine hydrolase [Prolixibacteraceae bacterium]|jgi:CubicO group peptidase (beta-lactamase class C family)
MKKLILIFTAILFYSFSGISQPVTPEQIDRLTEKVMKTFDVPGIAVAVVKDGKVVYAKGHGARSLKSGGKVDENTLFGIASNSKAFTTATLAILVDEKKLSWDDKVTRYIPEFRLYNSYVTEDFTIRDLITHRSGLGLGAGDLMIWPDSSDFKINDIIYNLRFLKQTSPFRTKFDYDNLLFMVAGEVVTRVSGTKWEQFVDDKIMNPLGMNRTAASFARLKDKTNVIDGHAFADNKLKAIVRHDLPDGECAAGGIYSSISDMSKWMIAQLNGGKYGADLEKQLFSASAQREMWRPQTIMPVRTDKYNSHFSAYGLGWFVTDVKGTKQVSHTGGMEGMVTQVTLLPELKLGIVVLTNQETGAAFSAITNTIKDSYLGFEPEDWVLHYDTLVSKNREKTGELTKKIQEEMDKTLNSVNLEIDPDRFAGKYLDDWLGTVQIVKSGEKLWFKSLRSPQLRGEMSFYKGNTFVVKWVNRSMNADAFIDFDLDTEGKADGFSMKPVSPLTDFSYDFQDLNFKRVEN